MDYIKLLEKMKPFFAIIILIFIVFSSIQLYNYTKLQKEIRDNCGYENREKVFCVCDKDKISNYEIQGNIYYEEPKEVNLTGSS